VVAVVVDGVFSTRPAAFGGWARSKKIEVCAFVGAGLKSIGGSDGSNALGPGKDMLGGRAV